MSCRQRSYYINGVEHPHIGELSISPHAQNRFIQRSPWRVEKIVEALKQSIPVEIDDHRSDHGLLHSLTDIVFIIREQVVATCIRYIQKQKIKTNHLEQCRRCRCLYWPNESNSCKWCKIKLKEKYKETPKYL